jgi:outer membrane cobalamin receptor
LSSPLAKATSIASGNFAWDVDEPGFIHRMTLAGAVSFDHFSDFGRTTNRRIAFNCEVVARLGFRANWHLVQRAGR